MFAFYHGTALRVDNDAYRMWPAADGPSLFWRNEEISCLLLTHH